MKNFRLSDLLQKIKKLKDEIYRYDETSTKQVIVLPLLQALGWNIFEREEVYPEYSMSGKRVDYSLRIKGRNKIFLEIKKPSEYLEGHERQLLEYAFASGVRLACLSNGITWIFYLPLMEAEWSEKRFYTIDLIEQDISDAEEKLINILSKEKVESGESFLFAEDLFKSAFKEKSIKVKLPEAWNKLISDPPPILIDIIADSTEKLSGFRPSEEEIIKFLSDNMSRFKLPLIYQERIHISSEFSSIKLSNESRKSDSIRLNELEAPSETAIHLRVPLEVAKKELNSLAYHKTIQEGLAKYWHADESGKVRAQSVCWLFCWAKTGMGNPAIANKSKEVFNRILDISFDEFDIKVGLDNAYKFRYEKGNLEPYLKQLLGR